MMPGSKPQSGTRVLYVQYTNPAVYPPLLHSIALLAEAGCRICQGELFSPARSSDEVEPFLRARRAA